MARQRCPHCENILPNANEAADESGGCPKCGEVLSATPTKTGTPIKQVARRSSAAPARDGLDPYYPPGPRQVPDDLTVPIAEYRQGVVLLFGTLMLFFVLYLSMLAASGLLIFIALRWLGLIGLPVAFGSLIVFLYLLKGLFKSEQEGKSLQVEVFEAEQPRLFGFIRRLCEEVGAPAPHRVFLSPDVNAAACFENSLLGLFRPTPKNLILGLGLVNVLTLSELKAVLAHEFGHFAQSSMKLGAYVYAVNRLLREIVVGRDWLDYAVLYLRSQPHFVGLIGTVCWGLLTGLRKGMTALFYAINFLDKSLSRQMEFHADLVAVSVTGSEAIVRALARLDFAGEALATAAGELKMAAAHNRYSRDLFIHHRDSMRLLRQQRGKPSLGEPPPLADDPESAPDVFDPEDGPPSMWADHPSNYDREQNAKREYVPCRLDSRPAWLIFDDPAAACELVTWRFYRVVLKVHRDTELEDAEAIQSFLHTEREAVTYDPRYHGLYDDRFIEASDVDDLTALECCDIPSPEELRQSYADLYGSVLAARVATYKRHIEEWNRIIVYRRESIQGKKEPLEFRGRKYGIRDIQKLLDFLDEQLAKDRRLLAEEDRAVLLVHYQMSRQIGSAAAKSMRERYAFHLALQRLLAKMLSGQDKLESALAFLADKDSVLPEEAFYELFGLFRGVRETLYDSLEAADKLRLPPLPHLKAGARLGPLLWDRPLVGRLGSSGRSISVKKIQKLQEQLAEVIDRARHMHFKSLGGILSLQEEIARRWLARFAGQSAPIEKK